MLIANVDNVNTSGYRYVDGDYIAAKEHGHGEQILEGQRPTDRNRTVDADRADGRRRRSGRRPAGHYGRTGLAEAGQVRRLDRYLHIHVGVDFQPDSRVDADRS